MKLSQALSIVQSMPAHGDGDYAVFLACGFMPLHLETFLTAHLASKRQNQLVRIHSGLYGDLLGNVRLAAEKKCDAVAIVLEWADLDPRLGYRHATGWRLAQIPDIVETVVQRLELLRTRIVQIAERKIVALVLPTLPLPPLFMTPPPRCDAVVIRLEERLVGFASELAATPMVRLLNRSAIDRLSPVVERLDLSAELRSGFPYTLSHAALVGQLLADLLHSAVPKKGLITDLDNTLWRGILGEDGLEGVSWDLDRKSYGHALYQGLLASLSDIGVLLAVCSKNDPQLVSQVMQRDDFLISPDIFFPVEVSWGLKSEAVRRY